MKNTRLVLLISLLVMLCIQLNAIHDFEEATVKQFKVLDSSLTQTTLEFSLPEFEVVTEELNGIEFHAIDTECDGYVPEEGKPELPIYSTLVAIPYQGSVSLEVVNKITHSISNYNAKPAQDYTVEDNNNRSFSFNADFYNSNTVYPTVAEKISEPGIIRDFRVVSLTFSPFSYNPSTRTLEVTDRVVYRLNYTAEPGVNEMDAPVMYSPSFEPVYRSLISNYNEVVDRSIPVHNKRILIIYGAETDATYLAKLDEFVTWKKQKGYKVSMASTADTGTTTADVKAYIQSKYNNIYTRPEYVILIGDTTGSLHIDCWTVGGGSSDYPYQQLAGGDTMGDVFIGRMPVENVTQFLTMANKVFTYERDTIPAPPAWYNSMLLAGYSNSAGQSSIYVNKFFKHAGLRVNPNYTFTELYGTPSSATMQSTINSGVAFFVYRGWVGMNGWDYPSDAEFTNAQKMPHCVINTCGTGNFNGSDATDSIVRYGTPAAPKGAITAIGMATSSTHTLMNNVLSSQIGDSIFNWGMRDMGAPLLTAKLLLYMIYNDFLPTYAVNFPGWCNLMGDPTVEVLIGTPQPIVAEYQDEVFPGQTCYPVHVEDNFGNPMVGAVVTIVNDGIQLIAETDAVGNVTFELPDDLVNNDSFIVTVSKHDHIPVYETIEVLSANGINVADATFLDAVGGNNNSNPDAGETLEINLTLNNPGTTAIANAVVEMSTTDPFISIIQNSASFGDIAAGADATNDVAYQVHIAGNTPPTYYAAIELNVPGQNYTTYLGLNIHNADINVDSYQLYDDNGILEPGETTWMSLSLINNGTHLVTGIHAELSSDSNLIYFNDDEAFYGNATPNSVITNITDGLSISARSQLLTGTDVEVKVHLYNDNGYDDYRTLYIPTGTPNLGSPTGPDAFGHYIYHSSDTNWPDAPVYNWIGIAPAEGGSGTQFTSITDSGTDGGDGDVTGADTIDNTNLPFTFTFYGVDYNEVYVCSNGFMTFVPTEVGTFRNFPIPGPMSPDPLIAPFWDDLVFQTGSGIYHWFDAANHLFIIEWYNGKNGYNSSSIEQFQVILYDPQYYPTSTGDGMVKIQYHTFNDIDAGDTSAYPPLAGQYSTVGFSNFDGTDGIQYLFDLQYGPTSQPITNGTALLITGEPYLNIEPDLALSTLEVTEANGNGFIEPGEFVEFYFSITNSGIDSAENVVANLTSNDGNIGIITGTSSYEFIPGNDGTAVNAEAFTAMIAPTTPNNSVIPLTLILSTEEDTWVIDASLTVTSPYIDIRNAMICDYESGNGNGLPNQDETFELIVNLDNPSLTPVTDIQTNLTCTNNSITITDADQVLPVISASGSVQAVYSVNIPSTVSDNTSLMFTIQVQATETQLMLQNFNIVVGAIGELTSAGVINGTVSVDTGAPALEDIMISTGDFTCYGAPDTGSFKLYAPIGLYSVTGTLEHYAADSQSNVILSQSIHIVSNVNLTLGYLAEATELSGSFDERELTLVWTAPNTTYNVIGYNVYRMVNDDEYEMLDYTTTESYVDTITEDGNYLYYVVAVYNEGVSVPSTEFGFDTAVGNDEHANPIVTELYGNYPNPFNPVTNIAYSLAESGNVKINIYNVRGQHVLTLTDEVQSIGKHVVQWNGKDANNNDCASGLYMYRFQTKGVNTIKKAMLLK